MTFIDELRSEGYKYIIVPKKSRKKFLATKAEMFMNDFDDNDIFEEFKATTKFEEEVLKLFKKNTFISIV